MIAPLRGPRAMLTGLPLFAGLALAGCANTPAPAPSLDQGAVVSAVVQAAEAAATLAISRTKDPTTVKGIQAAQAAVAVAWEAYQSAVADHQSASAAAVNTAVAAVLAALAKIEAPGVAPGG